MSRKLLPSLVIAAAVLGLAVVLNPSPEKHRAAIKASVAERSPLAGVLGVGALAAFASNYHTLGVVSWTRVNGRLLSVGAFGIVFVGQPWQDG